MGMSGSEQRTRRVASRASLSSDLARVRSPPNCSCSCNPGQIEQSECERAQSEIDRVVDGLLRNGDEPEGRP
jgi:hypothetical protein